MLHENWEDLAYFARAVNDELLLNNGLVKDVYRHVNPLVQEAFRQFFIEVETFGANSTEKYGAKNTQLGMGISHMDAETWFNDDVVRKNWSNIIAEVYNKYETVVKGSEVTFNPVSDELKAMQTKLDSAIAQISKMQEAMEDKGDGEVAKPEDGEEKKAEDEDVKKEE